MFLDEQIVEMVLEAKPQNKEEEYKILYDILMLCNDRVIKSLLEDDSNENILPSVKRVCNLWNSASKMLEKKGYPLLSIDGFKNYILNETSFSEILIELGL